MEPNTRSNTESAALILFGRIVSFAISTALPLVLVNKLDQAAFGLYKQVYLAVNTALNVVPLGVGMNLYFFLPRERTRSSQVVCNTVAALALAGLLAGGAIALWPPLLRLASKEEDILAYAALIGLTVFLWMTGSVFEIALIARQEMRLAMAVSIANSILRTSMFLLAALAVGSIESLLWGGIVYGALLVTSLLVYLASRFPGFWRAFDAELLWRQLSYAVPMGLMGLVWYFQSDLHNYFVSNQFSAEQFAIYSIGCFQLPLVQLMLDAAGSVLISQVSRLQELGQTDEILTLFMRGMRKMAAVLFPSYAYLMVMGHEFLAFLFPPIYAASWPILIINLTIIPMSVFLFDPVVRAYAAYRYQFLGLKLTTFVVLWAALWWATPRWGMVGAIGSVIVLMALDKAAQAILFARILRFGKRHVPLLGDTFRLAASAAVAAGAAAGARYFLDGLRPVVVLLICGVVYVAAYLAMISWLRVVEQEEMVFLRRWIRRWDAQG